MCRIISPHPYKTFLFLFCVEHIHKFRIGSEDCPNSKIHLFLVRLFSLTISHFVAVRNLFDGRTIYCVSSHSPRPISPIAKVLLSDAIFRLSEKSEKNYEIKMSGKSSQQSHFLSNTGRHLLFLSHRLEISSKSSLLQRHCL